MIKKEYLFLLIAAFFFVSLILFPNIFFGIINSKKQKELMKWEIEEIEFIQIYPNKLQYRLENQNLNFKDYKKKMEKLYILSEFEINQLLITLKDDGLTAFRINHQSFSTGGKFIIKFREKEEPEIIFFNLDISEKMVILDLPTGHYISNNYQFFYEILEKGKDAVK